MICINCKINEVPAYRKTLCDGCANAKKLAYEANQKPQETTTEADGQKVGVEKILPKELWSIEKPEVKKENGDWQSTVYNRNVAANSYEVGKPSNRFKLYFETVEDLKEKIQELKDAGLMVDTITGDDVYESK